MVVAVAAAEMAGAGLVRPIAASRNTCSGGALPPAGPITQR